MNRSTDTNDAPYMAGTAGLSRLRAAGDMRLLDGPQPEPAAGDWFIAPGWNAGPFLAVAAYARATRIGGGS